jgi:site-specific DNA-cytosine methylase
MHNKIILDLCGGTGAWSKPYRDAGYDVRLITLPEYDVRTYEPPENVYGILAAPPCTEFSLAKGSRPRNLSGAMEVVEACMKIIWRCRLDGNLEFWALSK